MKGNSGVWLFSVYFPLKNEARKSAGLPCWRIIWTCVKLGISPNVDLAISEVFAPIAEAAFFATMFDGVTVRRAALAAVAANLTSFGLGLLLFLALGW